MKNQTDNYGEAVELSKTEINKKFSVGVKLIKLAVFVVCFLVFTYIFSPFVIISAGERGVVSHFGAVQNRVLDEGLHFRVPIYQSVEKIDVRILKAETDAASVSKDLQDVHSKIALNFHVMPEKASWVWQNIGRDYKKQVIDPAVQEVLKAVMAGYSAEELITKREKVRTEIREMLKVRLAQYAIAVDDFSIVNFDFSKEFKHAIEDKQVAAQKAAKAQNDLTRIRVEAEQNIATAKAEAESLRLQREQVTEGLLELRKIERDREAIKKWNGQLPNVTSGAMPFLNIESMIQKKGSK